MNLWFALHIRSKTTDQRPRNKAGREGGKILRPLSNLTNKKSGRDFGFIAQYSKSLGTQETLPSVWLLVPTLSGTTCAFWSFFACMDRLVGGWYWWTCVDCVGKICWNYSVSISSPVQTELKKLKLKTDEQSRTQCTTVSVFILGIKRSYAICLLCPASQNYWSEVTRDWNNGNQRMVTIKEKENSSESLVV